MGSAKIAPLASTRQGVLTQTVLLFAERPGR